MASEDKDRNIASIETKKKQLENLVDLFKKRNFEDDELVNEGRNSKHLIYNYGDEKFEFIEISEGKYIENSLPSYSLCKGNKGCLDFWNNHINQYNSSIISLKRIF